MAETRSLVKLENPSKDLAFLVKNIQDGRECLPLLILTDKRGGVTAGSLIALMGETEMTFSLIGAISLDPGVVPYCPNLHGNSPAYVFKAEDIASAYLVK